MTSTPPKIPRTALEALFPDDVELMKDILDRYVESRQLPDGRICGVLQLLFHWTMHVDLHPDGYEDRYCYLSEEVAIASMRRWDGSGDPEGWHKHPASERVRDPGSESI